MFSTHSADGGSPGKAGIMKCTYSDPRRNVAVIASLTLIGICSFIICYTALGKGLKRPAHMCKAVCVAYHWYRLNEYQNVENNISNNIEAQRSCNIRTPLVGIVEITGEIGIDVWPAIK